MTIFRRTASPLGRYEGYERALPDSLPIIHLYLTLTVLEFRLGFRLLALANVLPVLKLDSYWYVGLRILHSSLGPHV